MLLDEAVQAHISLRNKLAAYIRSPDGALAPQTTRDDKDCAFGRWLHGEGSMFSALGEYQILVDEHARFHAAAAMVVAKANAGNKMNPEAALGFYSEYGTASRSVIRAIAALKKKVAARDPDFTHEEAGRKVPLTKVA